MSFPLLNTKHLPKTLKAVNDWLDGTASVKTKASPTVTNASFGHKEAEIVTSGSATAERYYFGAAPGVKPGHRKLVTLAAKGAAGDSVTFDVANISKGTLTVSAVAMTTVGQFILVEFRKGGGAGKWEVIDASNGVVTAA